MAHMPPYTRFAGIILSSTDAALPMRVGAELARLNGPMREIGADVMRHDTNMLFIRVGDDNAAALGEFMKARGVLINASPVVRLVMHLDVNRKQLAEVVAHWQAFLQR